MSFAAKRKFGLFALFVSSVFVAASGMSCPPGSDIPGGDVNPDVPAGDRPPRIFIIPAAVSPVVVKQGQSITFLFTASDGEAGTPSAPQSATARIFASKDPTGISGRIAIGSVDFTASSPIVDPVSDPRGRATWATSTAVPPGTYHIFGEADDHVNSPIRVTTGSQVLISNDPPQVSITNVSRVIPTHVVATAEVGDLVRINYTASDRENNTTLRLFASTNVSPTPAQQIVIANAIQLNTAGGTSIAGFFDWNTAGVPVGDYNIFAELDDHTFDAASGEGNPIVRTRFPTTFRLIPPGTLSQQPLPQPPSITFDVRIGAVDFSSPVSNLGLSSGDDVTVRYRYMDKDSNVTLTLLLDKDLISSNDDINNPGDPFAPGTNIIILPNSSAQSGDPTVFPYPNPDPANVTQIRANPRTLLQSAVLQTETYVFRIEATQIPTGKYFLRATVKDSQYTAHAYATGSITITSLASGTVNIADIGISKAGARFQGFSELENLGTEFVGIPDMDGDAQDELMIASRFGSPKNRFQPGAAYLIFGRRKTPFPPDTNGNGLPDVPSPGGPVDFPPVPTHLPNPYDPSNVGRFGGIISINSVSSFFRGTTYAMPIARPRIGSGIVADPPPPLLNPAVGGDADHPDIGTAGLTSITRVDLSNDGTPEIVFGLPFISGAYDHIDDDPVDGGCDEPYLGDDLPNWNRCDQGGQHAGGNDDMGINVATDPFVPPGFESPLDQGLVIAVDGRADLRTQFRKTVEVDIAGQFDPAGATDDEGLIHGTAGTPNGFRIRGGWHPMSIGPFGFRVTSDNEYGSTVAAVPSLDNDVNEELLISAPGQFGERGQVQIWYGQNMMNGTFGQDGVKSMPAITVNGGCGIQNCRPPPVPMDPTLCQRGCYIVEPAQGSVVGAEPGDRLGGAGDAGDFNQDGVRDLVVGAPGGPSISNRGMVYVIATPQGGIGNIDLSINPPPHLRVIGINNGDRFGLVQTAVRDMNGDGIEDIAFASAMFPNDGSPNANSGYVGVMFGDRAITGENIFSPLDVGTAILPGVKLFGPTANARAGYRIASAGDFNGDGYGDLVISSPGETRVQGGQTHRGVVYLVFGGQHLTNGNFNLSQVGTAALPGAIFIGRAFNGDPITFPPGKLRVPTLETVKGVGDVDGDGFDDIIIGAPHMDFVDTLSPNQRRIDAGEAYLIYGSNFDTNNVCNVPGYVPPCP